MLLSAPLLTVNDDTHQHRQQDPGQRHQARRPKACPESLVVDALGDASSQWFPPGFFFSHQRKSLIKFDRTTRLKPFNLGWKNYPQRDKKSSVINARAGKKNSAVLVPFIRAPAISYGQQRKLPVGFAMDQQELRRVPRTMWTYYLDPWCGWKVFVFQALLGATGADCLHKLTYRRRVVQITRTSSPGKTQIINS